MTVGPGEVQASADAAVAGLSAVLEPSGVVGSRAEWAVSVGSLQQVIDVATAAQNAAIVRLAAIEPEYLEDGTEVETHRALGHVALDAPAIVSGVLSTSQRHAEGRVEAAVLLAADGPEGSGTESGLGGLHAAMAEGRLDAYRASVIAEELEAAPVEVRAAVVTLVEPYFEVEDGAHLRRRCRRALARISPDLLRQRALQARRECGLRRWVAEPGVDRWEGTFPSEDAATAWAAIDALAHRYVKDGTCTHIEAARGKALTDLVAGQASIDTVLTITVPATGLTHDKHDVHDAAGRGADDLVEVTGPAGNQPVFVSRDWVTAMATPTARPRSRVKAKAPTSSTPTPTPSSDTEPEPEPESKSGSKPASGSRSQTVQVAPCHPDTGALVDPATTPAANALATHHAAPKDHPGTPPEPAQALGPPPQAPGGAAGGADAEIDGRRVDEASTVPRVAAAADIDGERVDGAVTLRRIAAGFGAGAYRPSASMAKRVKARDRRCRFPGCTVAAVFCDLDHVRPWPNGPTTDTNLICLCRRHHRVKQRPGWSAALAADGTVTWTDPTGRVRTTAPADALTCTILGSAATPPPAPASTSTTLTDLPDGPHSTLEFHLEHHVATAAPTSRGRSPGRHSPATSWRDDTGGRHSVELAPSSDVIHLERTTTPCRRPRRGRPTFPDEPPF